MPEQTASCSPVISVIVPVYHVEQYLRRCLDSILGQTFREFELLLVNDGGNEAETAICEEYARRDGRIVYLPQENRGLSGARNTALRVCRGEWIMFVDSDDWVRSDFCEKALESVLSTGADLGVFDLVYTCGNKTEGEVHRSGPKAGVYSGYDALKERLQARIQGYVWNKIYRAFLWEGVEFPQGEIWEDEAVLHLVMDRARTVSVIHDVLYYKPYRNESITSVAGHMQTWSYWLFRQRGRCYDYIAEHHPELLPLSRARVVGPMLKYAQTCLLDKPDPRGLREARAWAKARRFSLRGASVDASTRVRCWAFLHLPPLYRLMERVWRAVKKAAAGSGKRRGSRPVSP